MGRGSTAPATMLLAAALAGLPAVARAQPFDAEVRIDQLQPPSADSPFTRAEGPHTPFAGGIDYGFLVMADYAASPLVAKAKSGTEVTSEQAPVAHALLLHVGGIIAPVDWFGFELSAPFAVFETGEASSSVPGQPLKPGGAGVGDLRFGAHFYPYVGKIADVSLGARFWAPSGSHDAYLAGPDRWFRAEAVIAVAGEVDALLWGCTLGVAPLLFAGRDGDRGALSCAAHAKLAPFVSLGVEPHVALFTYAPSGSSQAPGLSQNTALAVQFEPMAAVRFHVGGFALGLGGGVGLGGAPGTAAARGVLGLSYVGRGEREKPVLVDRGPVDTDLDGIPDVDDACPDDAGIKALRGCPPKQDLDGDGIVEGDACPEQAGQHYPDRRANGCPDGDNDHVADPVDACPEDPGRESDGCPAYVRVVDGQFKFERPIRFTPGTALTPEGRAAVEEVVGILRARPKELRRIRVIVGTEGTSQELGDQRAEVMRQVLKEARLDVSRYRIRFSKDVPGGQVQIMAVP
ncbi:MAG: hypothetical protein HY744_28910 [Deltaproteobacteria bacterium]|nr:hypothetical protein [Deltaproteobacteria bacterium]